MDEATSHLDIDTEAKISEQIKQLNMTRVIIAHRPETIKQAQRVVVMHQGKVYTPEEMQQLAEGDNRAFKG
ncbi:hypothetical protein [Shewanella sp. MBTL60-007]|uniref:hypothetical protein n=1 Tax=Shewanella sp. MBTL60-007 TaxID=2815911 RepID=UPI001BBB6412|nr:hypothetical protein [Shewanella sp. MBTL60-007]GIU33089.1 hypothetical protein TUM3792_45850 [Shewanella sp. MBTL60-007]